ncbi:MAG: hypothetical protein N2C12_03100, partial [Planctomycetales bacterium]
VAALKTAAQTMQYQDNWIGRFPVARTVIVKHNVVATIQFYEMTLSTIFIPNTWKIDGRHRLGVGASHQRVWKKIALLRSKNHRPPILRKESERENMPVPLTPCQRQVCLKS